MIYDAGKKCETRTDIGSSGIVGSADDSPAIEEEEPVCHERGHSLKLAYVESFFQLTFVLSMVFSGCSKFTLEYIYHFSRSMAKYTLFLCFSMDFKDSLSS